MGTEMLYAQISIDAGDVVDFDQASQGDLYIDTNDVYYIGLEDGTLKEIGIITERGTADGEVLIWNSSTEKWEPGSAPTSASSIIAYGKVNADGSTDNISGAFVLKPGTGVYTILFTSFPSDGDFVIQLTVNSIGGDGNDDPDISYINQSFFGFQVLTGDNDNGGTDRTPRDIEFMFTVVDF